MTEPAEETTPTAPIASGGHDGQVYVHNPLTGEVKLVAPDEASTLVYSHGFQPLSKDDAVRTDSDQILKDSITPVDSITQGLGRGVTGGLSDLLPRSADEERERSATDQAFPWLTPISEGAGFLAPFGLSAGLGAIGEGVTGALRGGEEIGLLGRAATRAAGMGTEGAAYGGIGAAREAKTEDTPLTAQKLLSGMFGGGIIGGALGAGTGALEGSGSLLRGMFKDSSAAREELNAPGLRDSDVASILDRAGIPHQPGALDQLQAMLYNDPNITPEFMAAMKASPGIRDDVMIAANPARAQAESEFAGALNDLHEGNQEALRGWSGRLKREQAENWIGPDSEHVSDAGHLVDMLKMMDVPGRFNFSKDIVDAVEAAGKKDPQAFSELINSVSARDGDEAMRNVDRALLHGNRDVLNNLFDSKLLNDESLAKLLGREGVEPAWKTAALDYIDKHLENMAELSAQPKGYLASEGAGDLRKMEGLFKGARESIQNGDRANAFSELDFVKKRVGSVRGGGYISTGEGVRGIAQGMHEELRPLLENADLWGQRAAGAQKEMNALLHNRLTRDGDFYKAFYSGAGMPDPKNPWVEKMVADPAKIKDVMNRVVNPENSLELGIFKKHIAESEQLADIMKRFYSLDDGQKSVVDAMSKSSKVADSAMDNAMHYNLRINQGKILSQVAHGGARGAFGSIAAYALGGPLGLAGATVGRALMNPGRLWRMQAIVERMLGSHGGRVADGLAGIVGRAGGAVASATKGTVRAAGSLGLLAQDVMTRQQAYGSTLHDLAAIASNRDHVVKALASWHGPDFAHLPNAIPGMADSIQRAAQFCLSVAPARPEPGMFSDDELGLISASEAEEFSNTVHAAMDPAMTLAMMKDGRLTPQVLKAADTAAPELMQDMRGEISQALMSTTGNVKIAPLAQQGIAMFLGVTPSPQYTIALQSSWTANETKLSAKVSPGSLGDTGVNDRYSLARFSEADRIESGEAAQ